MHDEEDKRLKLDYEAASAVTATIEVTPSDAVSVTVAG